MSHDNLTLGDHLVSPRTGYDHHGIYIGNNEVIHYSGLSNGFDKGSIEITSVDEFSQGNGGTIEEDWFAIYSPTERVNRAYEKLGEDSYNIAFNNCEHFVNWCTYGVKSSPQVNKVISALGSAIKLYSQERSAAESISRLVTHSMLKQTVNTTIATTALRSAAPVATMSTVGVSSLTGAIGLTGAIAAAPLAAQVAMAAGACYGAKKVFDWIFE